MDDLPSEPKVDFFCQFISLGLRSNAKLSLRSNVQDGPNVEFRVGPKVECQVEPKVEFTSWAHRRIPS